MIVDALRASYSTAIIACNAGVSVALSAVGFFGLAWVIEGNRFQGLATVSGCLVCVGCYGMDRLVDSGRVEPWIGSSKPRRARWQASLSSILVFAAASLCAMASSNRWLAVFSVSVFPFSVLAYSVPIFPKTWPFRRVKDIPYIKALYVAGLWALLTLLVARSTSSRALATYAYIGLWVGIGAVFGDLKDIADDIDRKVRTIPSAIGLRATFWVLHIANCVVSVLVLSAILSGVFPRWFIAIECRAPLFATLLVYSKERPRSLELASQLGLDVIALMLFPLGMLGQHIVG